MRVLVLGAGVIGVTTAWYLARAGHEVTVVERQPGAALETSFANGGQISVSHAEPWANPQAPGKVLRWLLRADAPLKFQLRADPRQWAWGLRFLRECLPERARYNTAQLVHLGLYSRDMLNALRRETGIENDQLECGILHFFTEPAAFEHAAGIAELMRAHGCDLTLKTPAECIALEPALASIRSALVGATFTPSDQSGDAHVFTQRLAALAAGRGVQFRYTTTVESLQHAGGEITAACVRAAGHDTPELLHADAYVVALGSYSPLLLEPIGVRIPVYPAKGYSLTLAITEPARAPRVSLIDEALKIVFSRLGNRLRVAGTAELSGYDLGIADQRVRPLLVRVQELFPGVCDAASAQAWTGLRPATPGNLPLIGRKGPRNLYLNTGHGTLGWTLACGSGRAMADLLQGRRPEVAFAFQG